MKKSELRKIIKEEISKVLTENSMDGSVEHHIEQIEDDLMYGEFGTIEEVDGFLNAIIKGIGGIRDRAVENFSEDEEPDFMDPDFNPEA